MKLVKTHAFISPEGAASILLPVEVAALLQLDAWAFRLFAALVKLADFKTGKGQTGYPSLAAWMTAPKNERGGKQPATFTRRQLQTMLNAMESVGLVTLHPDASKAEGALFFEVRARDWKAALSGKRVQGRVQRPNAHNTDKHGANADKADQSRARSRAGIQSPTETLYSIKEGDVDNSAQRLKRSEGSPSSAPPGGGTPPLTGQSPHAQPDPRDPTTWARDASGALIPPMRVSRAKARTHGPTEVWKKLNPS